MQDDIIGTVQLVSYLSDDFMSTALGLLVENQCDHERGRMKPTTGVKVLCFKAQSSLKSSKTCHQILHSSFLSTVFQ